MIPMILCKNLLILILDGASAQAQGTSQWSLIRSWLESAITMLFQLSAIYWTALAALFTFGCLLGVVYAARQLRLSAWANAQDIVTEPDFVEARTHVLEHFEDPNYTPTPADKAAALLVCRRWDKLDCLVKEGFISKEKVLKYWRVPMGKCWIIVQERWKIIRSEREICEGHGDKWNAFYDLGKKAAQRIRNEGLIKL